MTALPVTVILLGEPVPWSRTNHGFGGRTGGVPSTFTPPKQRNTAAALKIAAQMAMLQTNGNAVLDEPLRFDLTAEFSIPASWSRRKRAAALIGEIRPGKKPDIDNIYKIAADALSTIIYRDDALIVEAHLRKVYSAEPKIVVTVAPVTQLTMGCPSIAANEVA